MQNIWRISKQDKFDCSNCDGKTIIKGKSMEKDQHNMDELKSVAVLKILEHLRDKKHHPDIVNISLKSLKAVAQLKATERVKDATQLSVIQELSKNKDDFKKYLEVSLPHLNPIRLLE